MKALLQSLAVVALVVTFAACGAETEETVVLEDTTAVESVTPGVTDFSADTTLVDSVAVDTTSLPQ